MIEIAGGILLALIVLLCLPLLLRGLVGILALSSMLAVGAFLLSTEIGRTLLPAAIAAGLLVGAVAIVSRGLDRRDAKREARSGWRIIGK